MAQKYVIDTSVVIKWINQTGEKRINEANHVFKLLQDHNNKFYIPELAKYEFCNVMLFSKKLSRSEFKDSIKSFLALPLNFILFDDELCELAYKMCFDTKIKTGKIITFYDASFAALAKKIDAELISDNIKHHGLIDGVKTISLSEILN